MSLNIQCNIKYQHFTEEYSMVILVKGDVRRSECGTGLTSVGETRQSLLEHRHGGLEMLKFVGFDRVLNNMMSS
jgi:hypothetical protein